MWIAMLVLWSQIAAGAELLSKPLNIDIVVNKSKNGLAEDPIVWDRGEERHCKPDIYIELYCKSTDEKYSSKDVPIMNSDRARLFHIPFGRIYGDLELKIYDKDVVFGLFDDPIASTVFSQEGTKVLDNCTVVVSGDFQPDTDEQKAIDFINDEISFFGGTHFLTPAYVRKNEFQKPVIGFWLHDREQRAFFKTWDKTLFAYRRISDSMNLLKKGMGVISDLNDMEIEAFALKTAMKLAEMTLTKNVKKFVTALKAAAKGDMTSPFIGDTVDVLNTTFKKMLDDAFSPWEQWQRLYNNLNLLQFDAGLKNPPSRK